MKNIYSFLKKNWDIEIILIITSILFLIIFLPFIRFNSLDKYDTPGLLSLSWFIKEFRFPDFQGWNPYFAAGFPQGTLYPPLFHYLVALFAHCMSITAAYKLVVTLAGLFIPASIYFFSKKVFQQKTWAIVTVFFVLIVLLVSPKYLGFSYGGLLDYELAPNFVTIPLFLSNAIQIDK